VHHRRGRSERVEEPLEFTTKKELDRFKYWCWLESRDCFDGRTSRAQHPQELKTSFVERRELRAGLGGRQDKARRLSCTLGKEWITRTVGVCLLIAAIPTLASDWTQISTNPNLTVFTKERTGSQIKELRAIGVVDAPSWVIHNVLDQVADYPEFMPYTSKAELIERKPHAAIIYFRWDPPLIGPRDVTVSVAVNSTRLAGDRTSYRLEWAPINTAGPSPVAGVTRITLDEGSWNLEPTEDGKKTAVTYDLFTDGGGGLPSFVINMANRQSVSDLFDAIRKQVTLPKYSQKK
jgi:Polyketide cyclase / dehydrase and lipid transport